MKKKAPLSQGFLRYGLTLIAACRMVCVCQIHESILAQLSYFCKSPLAGAFSRVTAFFATFCLTASVLRNVKQICTAGRITEQGHIELGIRL